MVSKPCKQTVTFCVNDSFHLWQGMEAFFSHLVQSKPGKGALGALFNESFPFARTLLECLQLQFVSLFKGGTRN